MTTRLTTEGKKKEIETKKGISLLTSRKEVFGTREKTHSSKCISPS